MNEPRTQRPKAVASLIALVVTVVSAGAVWWVAGVPGTRGSRSRPPSSEADAVARRAGYVGDRVCAGCHRGEASSHRESGHSMTLRPGGETDVAHRLDGLRVSDPEYAGVAWSYALQDRELKVSRSAAGVIDSFLIDFAFGSGRHAVTFVSVTDRDPQHPAGMEHRLTYYSGEKALDVTPGHETSAPAGGVTPAGRPLASAKLLRCFRCHTTTTSDQGRDILDVSTMVPNVSCERCHGPGGSHVRAARRGRPEAGRLAGGAQRTADDLMRACGACHRHPENTPREAIRPDNIEIVRHQPVGLIQSSCYKNSQGALSCLTCHDPHAPASAETAGYVAACLSCHSAAGQTACRVSPRERCLECHMPRRNSGQGILFTDHWIRVVNDGAGPPPGGPNTPPLAPDRP